MEFLLKSALISTVLYSFYKVFLQKETFFNSNRIYFLIGILISIILPLLIIPIYIEVNPIVVSELLAIPTQVKEIDTEIITAITDSSINWVKLIFITYLIGVVFLLIKFAADLFSLLKLLFYGDKVKEGNIIFVETTKELFPFSFFNFIVYNKNQFKKEELIDIIAHEKVHVNQKHSLDILLVQFLTILQWFNPFVWLYKKDLQQNLEYIADQVAQEYAKTQKNYQYLLLKTSVPNYSFALSNNFFNSHLKKRIMMLQKSKTNRMNQVKYLLLMPLIALFLYAFNTKRILIPVENNDIISELSNEINNQNPIFINPIHKANVLRISSEFGKRIHPISKEIKQHNGIDIIAYKNMDVYATANGTVMKVAYNDLKGNYIQIAHANNYQTNYHHLGNKQVRVNEQVSAGDIIGIVGNTGQSTAPHLHYEVVRNDKYINPISFVKYDTIKKEKSVYGARSTTKKYSKITNKFDIKRTITSKSSKKDLKRIKKEFKNKFDVDLKFYDVKRNKNKEIISIKIDGNTLNSESSFSYSQDAPIGDILLAYNKEQDEIYMENIDKKVIRITNKTNHKTSSHHYSSNNSTTNHPVNTVTTSQEFYILDGKEMSKDEMEKIDPATIEKIEVRKYTNEVSGNKIKEMKLFLKENIKQKTGWLYSNDKAYFYTARDGKYTFKDRQGTAVSKDVKKELLKSVLKAN